MHSDSDGQRVKVLLQAGDNVETLWAERIGADRFRLENSPFWTYGVSWLDVVKARPDPSGMLAMTDVVEKSGHRTLRLFLDLPPAQSPHAAAVLQGVNALGCTYEGMTSRYIAVDVPPGIELASVAAYLTENRIQWEHADPTFDDIHGSSGAT